MNLDKTIELQEIDPISIYGVNNRNLERLEGYFPKLKVIARGNELRLHGNASDIQRFEQALQSLIALRRRKSHLTPADVEQLFEEKEFRSEENNTDPYTIVYGNEGRIITARTPSQKKLVDLYAKTTCCLQSDLPDREKPTLPLLWLSKLLKTEKSRN